MAAGDLSRLSGLPGFQLVDEGMADLRAGRETVAACLVSMAAPRLQLIGIGVPSVVRGDAGHRLYELLADDDRALAHSRYNALVGQLTSFARAAEHARPG